MGSGRYRFGEFEFDASSGELQPLGADAAGGTRRLPPQPARLLSLLVEREGGLVTRDEIREAVWPGVQVEFDTSLHYCVRQIRAALGESASESRYIETLPRRGYRLLVPVTRVADAPQTARGRTPRLGGALAAAVALAAVLGWWLVAPPRASPPVRVAVMPFEPPAGSTLFGEPGPIAEWILADLTPRAGKRAGIVGPTTTASYGSAPGALTRMAADLDLDYVVNARFMDAEDGPRMLAELIRVSDGAHVWVRAYEDLSEDRRIGLEISGEVARRLGLAP